MGYDNIMAQYSKEYARLSEANQRLFNEAVKAYPCLSEEREKKLFYAWRQHGDLKARDEIVLSHLPLAFKMSMRQKGYGLHMDDLFGFAQVGLLKAIEGFDTERGFRFGTFARWSVKEELTNYIVPATSIVKAPSTAAMRSLFFNLNRLKTKFGIQGSVTKEEAQILLDDLALQNKSTVDIDVKTVMEADAFMSSKAFSLDAPVLSDEGGQSASFVDHLMDESLTPADEVLDEMDEVAFRRNILRRAVSKLPNERERHIFVNRKLSEPLVTLEELGVKYGVSRERIRQIEHRAFGRVTREMKRLSARPAHVRALPPLKGPDPLRLEAGSGIVRLPLKTAAQKVLMDERVAKHNGKSTAEKRRAISLRSAATLRTRRAAAAAAAAVIAGAAWQQSTQGNGTPMHT